MLLLLALAACGGEEKRVRPSNVLSPDSMALFMAEVQLVNAKSQHRESRRKKLLELIKKEQLDLFDSLGVDKECFDRSMDYYMEDVSEMEQIHIDAMNILSERMAKIKSAQSKNTDPSKKAPIEPGIRKRRR